MLVIKRKALKFYMKRVLKKERVYDSEECSLKHLLIKNKKSNVLLVVFSGFPADDKKATYNYVLKFRKLKCNKLFILDDVGDDPRGTYYLGEGRNLFIDRAVNQLIDRTASKLNVSKDNIITAGSSKGGYASLYFAYKYNYGAAIAGAPQILLGDYLSHRARRNIMTYISGNDEQDDVDYLNRLLLDVIKNSKAKPKTYIHVSKNEHHYEGHVKHLTKKLHKINHSFDLDLGNYMHHGEVGKHYSHYAIGIIQKITGG